MKKLIHTCCALALLGSVSGHAAADAGQVNVYNWGNSLAKNSNANFLKQTGIKVRYQEFDSNDTLMSKLLVGNSGYDVVVPSDAYFGRQLQAGMLRKLDKSKIPNLAKLDPALMKILEGSDPGNQYGVPLNWGTDGIGINLQKVESVLGKGVPLNTWDMLFDPKYMAKLSKCGVSVLDSPVDMFGMGLYYLKKNPLSTNPADYQEVFKLLKTIRPYIGQFNSSSYGPDLASGDICMAFGYSGDVNTARIAALAAHKPYTIQYILPKEGSVIWFDVMAVPKTAPNFDAAMKWINHVISPTEAAALSNETFYPSAVPAAKPLIRPEVLSDPTVYPSAAEMKKLFTVRALPTEIMRLETRLWQELKTH
ncbi:putrescine ABC transporter putrescine-binding protein PotF [Aquitalea magnusonii]|jgi:putative spermidine/putrescine transport system substrate-binding protein/putrescine transport system substrate-binding protein|uniref:Putrescine-binding periplasmic protein n=1 Tax=Aquitalea magnusonii TaxID=332411 RepID=A0A3G9GG15_9NEIS|nr:extracellular solute-binding protein [Aquitalea magnusonii]BBF85191.1 putrescine ABC transporter putrescine-binding protein PotF [Aquitalea magnusonii]